MSKLITPLFSFSAHFRVGSVLWTVGAAPGPDQNSVITIIFSPYMPARGQAATKCHKPINFALASHLAHIHPNLPMK